MAKCYDCGEKLKNMYAKRCRSCHDIYNCGENNPLFKKKNICIDCGKELTRRDALRCRRCSTQGEYNPAWKGGLPKCIDCSKTVSYYGVKRCVKCNGKKMKKLYINSMPEWLKCHKFRHKKNKQEKILGIILNRIIPKEYKYVGQGDIWIERYNPDFININGQKKIIELFGEYWHKLPEYIKRDKRKIKIYKKYGYDTLVIWTKELKNNTLYKKIINFNKT